MRIKLALFIVAFCTVTLSFSQSQLELAEKYLEKRGELVFTFTANNIKEVKELSRIVWFDHHQDPTNPLRVNAISNEKSFERFLKFELPFEVNIKANEPKDVEMFNPKIHKKNVSGKSNAYTLSFPLTSYPTYAQYAQQMKDFVNDHSDIAELVDIGETVQGDKRLLFIKLSDSVNIREAEPRVMYTSSMHGDEIAGFPAMLNLIDYLITAYKDTGHSDHLDVKNLIDNSEVWINPLANPDATYWDNPSNESVTNSRRANANNIDLNRNYPDNEDGPHPDGEVYQVETLAFMQLASDYHFVLSANFHGGTEVVNYPWDNRLHDEHPDDRWYYLVSKEYAEHCQADGHSNYMDEVYNWDSNDTGSPPYYYNEFPGVTRGSVWYQVFGGRQDYMNFSHQCREITIELSNLKTPPNSPSGTNDILDLWYYNQNAYFDYLEQGTFGFKGIVKDAVEDTPIDAKITIIGRDDQTPVSNSWVETELPLGDFYRPIEAGTYNILIEADCYNSLTLNNQTITNGSSIDLGNIMLTQSGGGSSVPNGISESNLTQNSLTIDWTDSNPNYYEIRYRIIGETVWLEEKITSNTIDLTELSVASSYEYQIRSFCGGFSSYSTTNSFTTLGFSGTTISSFPYQESFEGSGSGSFGDWENSNDDFFNWTNKVEEGDGNSTPSSNTGPALASDGSYFLFTEASTPNYPSKMAVLYSPFFDFTGLKNAQLTFDYHMFGAEMGSISIAVSIDGGSTYEHLHSLADQDQTSYGGAWVNHTVDLGDFKGRTVKIRITGITGIDYTSDMAIDNISITAEIDDTLGIQDELLSQFVMYPNPTDGQINLTLPQEITEFNVEVSNIMGQKVYTEEVKLYDSNKHSFKLSNIKSGVYFISISTDLGKASKKIIIK